MPESKVSVSVEIERRFGGILPYLRAVVADRERRVHPNSVLLELETVERVIAALAERDAEIADYRQTSGDLCPICSWRGVRGYGCEFCALVKARDEIAEMRKVLRVVHDDLLATRGEIGCKCVPGSYNCPLHVMLASVYTIEELDPTPKENTNV